MLLPAKPMPDVSANTSAAESGASNTEKPPTTKKAPISASATAPARRSETDSPRKRRPPSTDHTGAR